MIPWVRGKFAERRARWLTSRKQSPNSTIATDGSCSNSSSPKAHSLSSDTR